VNNCPLERRFETATKGAIGEALAGLQFQQGSVKPAIRLRASDAAIITSAARGEPVL